MKEFEIHQHGEQPDGRKPAKMESHHVESQTRSEKFLAGYDALEDPTVLLTVDRHRHQISNHQRKDINEPTHNADLGTSQALTKMVKHMEKAGVPEPVTADVMAQHDAYNKSLTPFAEINPTIEHYKQHPPLQQLPPPNRGTTHFKADADPHAVAEWGGSPSTPGPVNAGSPPKYPSFGPSQGQGEGANPAQAGASQPAAPTFGSARPCPPSAPASTPAAPLPPISPGFGGPAKMR